MIKKCIVGLQKVLFIFINLFFKGERAEIFWGTNTKTYLHQSIWSVITSEGDLFYLFTDSKANSCVF